MRTLTLLLPLTGLGLLASTLPAPAAGDTITGDVVRGLTVGGAAGAPGTATGKTCDFSREAVSQAGRLEDASVNCGGTAAAIAQTLAPNFTAYCTIPAAKLKSATLIKSALPNNRYHCSLSAITIKDATQQFGGASWR